jgi:hypothetical protein
MVEILVFEMHIGVRKVEMCQISRYNYVPSLKAMGKEWNELGRKW